MKIAKTQPYEKRFKILGRYLLLYAFAALIAWGCQVGSKPETTETKRPFIAGVKTISVVPTSVDDIYETSGTIKADQVSTIAARVMGTVSALYVREGDAVKSGQLLMTIDSRELSQKVRGASMALESAKQNKALADITWHRYRKLYEEKALSQQEMDQMDTQKKVAESEYERVRATLEEARTYEEFARIKAPFAGTVISRPITEGGMAVPGQPLLTIENTTSLYVEGHVAEALSGRLKKGMPVYLSIEAGKEQIRGTIRDIISAVDPRSRTFLVKIALASNELKSGLFAVIHIPVGKKESLLVPVGAVVSKGQLTGVYVAAPKGIVSYRLVKTGRTLPDGRIEILSGLSAKEMIISEGIQNAVDGGIIQ